MLYQLSDQQSVKADKRDFGIQLEIGIVIDTLTPGTLG